MSKIRFYADVHVPRSVTRSLLAHGVDVLTAQDRNLERASDEEHLSVATSEGRVMITQDSDFLVLDSHGVEHAGIAYTRQRTPIGAMISGLLLIYDGLSPEEMRNHIESCKQRLIAERWYVAAPRAEPICGGRAGACAADV